MCLQLMLITFAGLWRFLLFVFVNFRVKITNFGVSKPDLSTQAAINYGS